MFARRVSILGWVLTALVGCAVGTSDGSEGGRVRRDAGADAEVEGDASDSADDPDAGPGAGGSGGSGDDGGTEAGGGGDGGTGGDPTCTPPAASGQCDPFEQCGCNAGQNCIFTGATDGETRCRPAGTTAPFSSCSNHDQCQAGHACVGGVCKPFCQGDGDCAASNGTCQQLYVTENGAQTPISFAKACSAACDLRTPQTVCGNDQGVSCIATDEGGTDCVGGFGTGVGAGACSGNDWQKCAPGYLCINGSDCLRWCRVNASGDCSGGQSCYPLVDPVVIDGVNYGVCD